MHGFPWVKTKADSYGGAIEETCGCNCGCKRWRGISDADPSYDPNNADAPEQKWRVGPRPDPCDVTTLT